MKHSKPSFRSFEPDSNPIAVNRRHPLKQLFPRLSTEFGIQMDLSEEHLAKQQEQILCNFDSDSNRIVDNELQPLKQLLSSVSTEFGT
jgi:hypothetical protein